MKDFGIPISDAWNCTLREYIVLMTYKDKKAIRPHQSEESRVEAEEHFELMSLRNG